MEKQGLNAEEIAPYWRPKTRADCENAPRPCPFVACKYHLYLDVHPGNGSLKINVPHRSLDDMEETCALDVAERGGLTLEEISALFGITRERIRQIESHAIQRLKEVSDIALSRPCDDENED